MSHDQNHKPKSPKKKSNFMAKLFHRKSKRTDNATTSHTSDKPSAVNEDACNTNVNNHQGPGITDVSDFAGSENEENTHLEEALLQSYHASNQPMSIQPSAPPAPPRPGPVPRPRATQSISDSTKALLWALAVPFYVIYQVLLMLFTVIRVLFLGLASLAGSLRSSRQASTANRSAITLKDNPLIALLIFPVTILVLIGEGLSALKPRVPQAPRHRPPPPNLGQGFAAKFFHALFSPPRPLVAAPRFTGRPLAGRPCKCRCKECVVM